MNSICIAALVALLTAGCGRPKIDQSCTMNGHGEGECAFTNTGTGPGSVCGHINLIRTDGELRDDVNSATFCSGEVAKNSTVNVEFTITDVDSTCDAELPQRWGDVCGFSFEAHETPRQWWQK